jgi:hypothetical protein
MVRLVVLTVLASACLAAAPAAQAADLPVDVQSSVAAAVDQAQAVAGTATQAAPAATPQVSANTTTPVVGSAADLAQPAAKAAEYTAAAAVSVIADGPRDTDGGPPVRSARFKQGHGHTGSSAARARGRAALSRDPVSTTVAAQAVGHASHATGAAPRQHPAAPDRAPSTAGGGAASAPAAGLSLGGLALLAIAISLAGPRLRRRLATQPFAVRPAAFVSLLERPG